jgi:anti-sigma regulatory factor (Ser/Thr protein kinase)
MSPTILGICSPLGINRTPVLAQPAAGIPLTDDDRMRRLKPPHSSTVPLPASLDAPALARLHLRQVGEHLTPANLDDALILTSELVTNAVVHGEPEISLTIRIEAGQLTITVHDASPVTPPVTPALPLPATPHGRGLAIVDSLAVQWGVTRHAQGPGKAVWVRLLTP